MLIRLLALLLLWAPCSQAATTALPGLLTGMPQFFSNQGAPLSGGKVYTCQPGTTCGPGTVTPKSSYTDITQATPNANPVILDSAGRASIWLNGYYKIALYDSSGALVKTLDNVSVAGAVSGITAPVFFDATSGPVSQDIKGSTEYIAYKTDASVNAVTLIDTSGNTFPGGLTSFVLSTPNSFVHLVLTSGIWKLESVSPADLQLGTYTVATAGGTSDAITATYSPVINKVTSGLRLSVNVTAANTTTTPTFSPNGLTPVVIVKGAGSALAVADIPGSGFTADLIYFGANWYLLNPATGVTSNAGSLLGGFTNITATGALPASALGKLTFITGTTAAQTLTLPATAGLANGQGAWILNLASVSWTIKGNASENIYYLVMGTGSLQATNTLTLNPDDMIFLVSGNGGSWQEVVGNRAANIISGTSTLGSYRNWKADSIGVNNYNCVVSADEVTLRNSQGVPHTVSAVSKTINANGSVGAPLSIMSSRVALTWYYIWLWYNQTNGLTATLDISSSAPTAPTGYVAGDFKSRMPGEQLPDASGSTYLLQLSTRKSQSKYIPLAGSNVPGPPVAASASGTVTFPTAVAIGNFVPPTAGRIGVTVSAVNISSGGGFSTAPSSVYTTNPGNAPLFMSNTYTSGANMSGYVEMVLESTNIYWGGSSTGTSNLYINGWESNI